MNSLESSPQLCLCGLQQLVLIYLRNLLRFWVSKHYLETKNQHFGLVHQRNASLQLIDYSSQWLLILIPKGDFSRHRIILQSRHLLPNISCLIHKINHNQIQEIQGRIEIHHQSKRKLHRVLESHPPNFNQKKEQQIKMR